MMMNKRPNNPITMAGMIWNANHVLASALDPKTPGVPRALFEHDLKGIILISTVEVGLVFTGNVGSGILLARRNGGWSPPCAVGLGGVGWGFIVGASIKDVMVFLFDESTVSAVAGTTGFKFGGQAELTLGSFGRNAELAINASDQGVGATIAISFTKGVFGGISLAGAVVGPRSTVNKNFYKESYTPIQILYEDIIELPEGTLMPEVYDKLDKLMEGATVEPTPEELTKVEAALEEAERLGEEAAKEGDVVLVDAKAEAEKEASSAPF